MNAYVFQSTQNCVNMLCIFFEDLPAKLMAMSKILPLITCFCWAATEHCAIVFSIFKHLTETCLLFFQISRKLDLALYDGGFLESLKPNLIYFFCSWKENYINWIVWIAGAVQTAIYSDFLYYYVKAKPWESNKGMTLPL